MFNGDLVRTGYRLSIRVGDFVAYALYEGREQA
jgi:hypothetical protein